MLKANLPKSGNKPKNSVKSEQSIFDLGDVDSLHWNKCAIHSVLGIIFIFIHVAPNFRVMTMAFPPFIPTDIIFIRQIILNPVLGKVIKPMPVASQKSPKEGNRLKWPVQRQIERNT